MAGAAGHGPGRRDDRGRLALAGAPAAAQAEGDDRARRARGPGAGAPRPLGRAARRGRAAPPTSGSPRASATARTGSGRWTSTAASSPAGVSEMAGEEGLPIDRLMRTLGIRRTAEREAATLDPELLALLERFCEGVNAAAADAKALPFEMQLLRLDLEALAPGRHPQPRQAARLRPLDQLGAGAAARRHGAGARPRAGRQARLRPTRPTTRSSPRKPGRATAWRSSSRSTRCAARSASPPRPAAPTTGRSRARSAPAASR